MESRVWAPDTYAARRRLIVVLKPRVAVKLFMPDSILIRASEKTARLLTMYYNSPIMHRIVSEIGPEEGLREDLRWEKVYEAQTEQLGARHN